VTRRNPNSARATGRARRGDVRRPPIQLPSVTFSAGGYNTARTDASRVQNPVTANPEESILKGVGDVMSYPQRRVVQMLTGTYQDPSAALGVQNPIGAFATDVVLDPANLIPAGVMAKLFGRGAKVAGAAGDATSLARRQISPWSNYKKKNYIDSNKYVSESIGGDGQFYRVSDELRNQMEIDVMRGGDWLGDWYSQRMDKFSDLLTPKIQNQYQRARDFGPEMNDVADKLKDPEKYIRKSVVNELMSGSHRAELEPSNIMDLNAKVLGVSSNHFDGILEHANIPKPADSKKVYNYVLMAADQNPRYTAIHEGTHGMDFALGLTRTQDQYGNFDFGAEVFESMKLQNPDMPLKDIAYYSDPKEIYARTNELRYMNNVDPNIEVTTEMARKMLKFDTLAKSNRGIFDTFLGTNPSSLARWMNTMPALAGAAMMGNQMQKK
jgi:hypothetical protein